MLSSVVSQHRELPGSTRIIRIRSGMTLVEVIVGLTLLASIGTGSVLAFGAHQRQIKTARQTIAAARIADRLLADWTANSSIPIDESGPTETPEWFWSTRTVRADVVAGLPVRVVELMVMRRNLRGELQPSVRIEVVVDLKEPGSA